MAAPGCNTFNNRKIEPSKAKGGPSKQPPDCTSVRFRVMRVDRSFATQTYYPRASHEITHETTLNVPPISRGGFLEGPPLQIFEADATGLPRGVSRSYLLKKVDCHSEDATGLPRGVSRSPLLKKVKPKRRCHGLAPWSFTLATTQKAQSPNGRCHGLGPWSFALLTNGVDARWSVPWFRIPDQLS